MTDPIADMLTRIRNALAVNKTEVIMPFSKIKFSIGKILEREGWVNKIEKIEENYGQIKIDLKYNKKQPAISGLKRISKPGCRIYVNKDNLPVVLNDQGIAIISTSSGIMTNKEARKKRLGGEVICEIW